MKALLIDRFRTVFGELPQIITRAPGRIEVIGNHTDYNGGPVIGASIDRGVWVGLRSRNDGRRRFASDQHRSEIELPADHLEKISGENSWANYPLGVLAVFKSFGLKEPQGFDYFVVSDLPAGAGLSSSAAIELASALAFLEETKQTLPREALVRLCQEAENKFVGVPCGILDQGVSGFGEKDRLVLIDCRGPRFATEPLPAGAQFWIFNTHARHALVDGLYAERHRECMAAAKALGVSLLADVTAQQVDAARASLSAVEFKRAKHVVDEIDRVMSAVNALRTGDLAALGELLTASHRSSQQWFENSVPELDFLVDELSTSPHVYGARLTGGGFGGAVLALTDGNFRAEDGERVAKAYAEKFKVRPDFIHCRTANGAEVLRG